MCNNRRREEGLFALLLLSNKKGRWFCELFFDSQIRYASESEFKYPYDSNQNVVIL